MYGWSCFGWWATWSQLWFALMGLMVDTLVILYVLGTPFTGFVYEAGGLGSIYYDDNEAHHVTRKRNKRVCW